MAKKKNRNRNNNGNQQNPNAEHQRFASTSTAVSGTFSKNNINSMTEERLKSTLQDASSNAVNIANFSEAMKNVNGIYKQVIRYLSTLCTYDHTIYPVMENPIEFTEDPSALKLAFAQTAIVVDRYNPKFFLPIFTDKIFTKGVTYQYKLEDSKSIAYQEFPLNYCRISYMEEGVYRYQFDVTKVSDASYASFPKEIQNAVDQYKKGQTDKLIEGKWHQVSDKGVAFTMDTEALNQGGMALPPLASMLIDTIKVENAKNQMETTEDLDNTKIIHSKIETDDRGRPLMELNVVQEYHNAMKRNLPSGSVAVTNPFETKALTLNGTGKDGKFALLDKVTDLLYKGSGVSGQLFADDNSSSQALERSIQVDCQWLYSYLLPMFNNYYNYELKKAGKKGTQWKMKLLPISNFDRKEAIKTSKDQLTYGCLLYTSPSPRD